MMNDVLHAKEPWKIGAMESGMVAIDSIDNQEVTGFIDPEDARRILACVNACAGIPTDVLEEPDTEGQDLARRAWEKFDSVLSANEVLRKQRDELLAAAELVVHLSDRKHDAWDSLKAAIASAKGGAA